MTYLEAVIWTGAVFWAVVFLVAVVATFVNTVNGDFEQSQITANIIMIMLPLTAFCFALGFFVWIGDTHENRDETPSQIMEDADQ